MPSATRRPRRVRGVRPTVRAAPRVPAEGRRTAARRPGAGADRPVGRRAGNHDGGRPPAPGLPAPPADGVPPVATEDGEGTPPHGGTVPPRVRPAVRPPRGAAAGRLL